MVTVFDVRHDEVRSAAGRGRARPAGGRPADSAGEKYGSDSWIAARPRVLHGRALDDLLQRPARGRDRACRRSGRGRRSSALRCGERRAVGERRRAVGPRRKGDEAVGDARERRRADLRRGALVQRSDRGAHRDRDLGEVVARQRDVGDVPDGHAADLDLVALDELAGVGEQEVVRARAVRAEHEVRHDRAATNTSSATTTPRA